MADHSSASETNDLHAADALQPSTVINHMIELRCQLAAIRYQIQALQPAFFEACTAQQTNQIKLEQAVITRKVTPGKWTYPPHILQQEAQLKQLKRHFQQTHEPTQGRDVIWSVKLLGQ